MSLRIFFSADVHGATRVWRKWIKSAEVHKANVLMFCGDLTGKSFVPLIKTTNSHYKAYYFGKEWYFESDAEVKQFEKKLEDSGTYYDRMTEEEVVVLRKNNGKVESLMAEKMRQRLDRWMEMLVSTIDTSKVQCIVMPGNDDVYAIDDIIKQYEKVNIVYPLEKIIKVGGIEIISLAHVNVTPWNTAREATEKDLKKMMERLIEKSSDPSLSLFNFHAPPYGTRIDLAPQLDKKLKPVLIGGEVNMIHVGSKAVREVIEKYQPLLGLHGHIHESSGAEKLGQTISLNPGSEYAEGILRGFIIEISGQNKINYWRVEG